MISINGINWKMNNIPERLILKHKQNFKISYLLSKIFLDKNYTDEEIYNSISKNFQNKIEYNNKDFEYASYLLIDNLKKKKKYLFLVIMMLMVILQHIYCMIILKIKI